MTTPIARNYNCKDEELVPICLFAYTNLCRDMPDFFGYSSTYTQPFADGYHADIINAKNLIDPQSETVERKLITGQMYDDMSSLHDPISRLTGYINLSSDIKISISDFGITQLHVGINNRDAEHVVASLHIVNANIVKYTAALTAKGMTADLAAQFATAAASIETDRQKQRELKSTRAGTVQNNVGVFNALYAQLSEILSVGKILYKSTNPSKLQDYTFTFLKQEVHGTAKTPVTPPTTPPASTPKV